MRSLSKACVVAAGLFVFSAPAAAQTFQAEIDCGEDWRPGDSVPFTVRFEEQGFQQHTIQVVVTLDGPGNIAKTLINKTFTLNANQDIDINKVIKLKPNAPLGDYDLRVVADAGNEVRADDCGFDVGN